MPFLIGTMLRSLHSEELASLNNDELHIARECESGLRWLQEVAESGHVRFTYVASHDQAADPMTKPLDEVNFTRFRHMMVS